MSIPKQRSEAFTSEESIELSTQVKHHEDALFGKFSLRISKAGKEAIWQQIADAVNAIGGYNRTIQQIKTKCKNIKAEAKKIAAANKAEVFKTGGGISSIIEFSEPQRIMLETIPTVMIDGIQGGVDTSEPVSQTPSSSTYITSHVLACVEQNPHGVSSTPENVTNINDTERTPPTSTRSSKRKFRPIEKSRTEILMEQQVAGVMKQVSLIEQIRDIEKEKLKLMEKIVEIKTEELALKRRKEARIIQVIEKKEVSKDCEQVNATTND